MVRCYDCGQPIPDEQIIRRVVKTGTSRGSRSRSYYHTVNLCPRCAAERAKTGYDRLSELIHWIRADKVRALKAFAFIGVVMSIVWICTGCPGCGQEKKQPDAHLKEPFDVLSMKRWDKIPGSEGRSHFLGISSDLKVYARVDHGGVTGRSGFLRHPVVKIIDRETEKVLPSPKWEPQFANPFYVAFSQDAIAIVHGSRSEARAVLIFSRETGELKQDYFAGGDITDVAFTPDGKSLRIKVGAEIRSVELK